MLSSLGYEVSVVSERHQAIRRVNTGQRLQPFDGIADVIDGYEARGIRLRWLHPGTIIALTANAFAG